MTPAKRAKIATSTATPVMISGSDSRAIFMEFTTNDSLSVAATISVDSLAAQHQNRSFAALKHHRTLHLSTCAIHQRGEKNVPRFALHLAMFRGQVQMDLKPFLFLRARVTQYPILRAHIGDRTRMQCRELTAQRQQHAI